MERGGEGEKGRRGEGEKGRRGERQLVSGPELTPHNTVNYHHLVFVLISFLMLCAEPV
jgi:hypothetical protein